MSFWGYLYNLIAVYCSVAAIFLLGSPWIRALAIVAALLGAQDIFLEELRRKGVIGRV